MRISGILNESIVDGPGIRVVIFAQGCLHNCFGCQNPDTHDMSGGKEISLEKIYEQIKSIIEKNKIISGVTFSGGDPFFQSKEFAELGKKLKKIGLSVIAYTGFTFEQLLEKSETDEDVKGLLEVVDILVDGRYLDHERDLTLCYRGSRNQRLIDIKTSLIKKEAVLWQEKIKRYLKK